MFDPFERVARAHHICPCCERPFSAEEEDDFVKKVDILYLFISVNQALNLLLVGSKVVRNFHVCYSKE